MLRFLRRHRGLVVSVAGGCAVLLAMKVFAPTSLIRLWAFLATGKLWLYGALLRHMVAVGCLVLSVLLLGGTYVCMKLTAPDELAKVLALLWVVLCWTYIIRWKIRMASRHRLFSSVLGVLFAASFYVVIEVGLVSLRALFAEEIPYMPHLHAPVWLEIVLLLLSFIMVRHHWKEWRLRHLNADMPEIVEKLLRVLDQSRAGSNEWTEESRGVFLEELMSKMKGVLERNSRRKIAFSLMEQQEDGGDLAVVFSHPATNHAHNENDYKLHPDEGGAGAAFGRRNSIYIPSTKHLIAIDVEKNETIGQIYKPDPPDCPYHCVFCVPIMGKSGEVTVLNISCTQESAFDVFEFSIGRLMAAMIAMLG